MTLVGIFKKTAFSSFAIALEEGKSDVDDDDDKGIETMKSLEKVSSKLQFAIWLKIVNFAIGALVDIVVWSTWRRSKSLNVFNSFFTYF